MESIGKCYVCGLWFDALVLIPIKVPDQAGCIQKPVCKVCLRDIENRSKGGVETKDSKQLLMEGGTHDLNPLEHNTKNEAWP